VREPAGRRLATRKARQKRAYRRALYRFVARSGFGSLQRWQVRLLEDGQAMAVHGGDPHHPHPITLRRTR
jgi:hypothetical protein